MHSFSFSEGNEQDNVSLHNAQSGIHLSLFSDGKFCANERTRTRTADSENPAVAMSAGGVAKSAYSETDESVLLNLASTCAKSPSAQAAFKNWTEPLLGESLPLPEDGGGEGGHTNKNLANRKPLARPIPTDLARHPLPPNH